MRHLLLAFLFAMVSTASYGQLGRRIDTVTYYHSTVGGTAADAIPAMNLVSGLKGWRICHDAGSSSDWLAISVGADPATDGIRIAAGACYVCDECGFAALKNANVKASAASTGYSVLQLK